MSTSYVEFRGHGFWSFDPYLEDFFSALAASIPQNAPTWLEAARAHWLEQSGGAFAGWIRPRFDELASDEGATSRADHSGGIPGRLCASARAARDRRVRPRTAERANEDRRVVSVGLHGFRRASLRVASMTPPNAVGRTRRSLRSLSHPPLNASIVGQTECTLTLLFRVPRKPCSPSWRQIYVQTRPRHR